MLGEVGAGQPNRLVASSFCVRGKLSTVSGPEVSTNRVRSEIVLFVNEMNDAEQVAKAYRHTEFFVRLSDSRVPDGLTRFDTAPGKDVVRPPRVHPSD